MVTLASPISGWPMSLDQVNDPVFSQRFLGEGIAIAPFPQSFPPELCYDADAFPLDKYDDVKPVLAPTSGKIVQLFHHAFALEVADFGVLVHLGIDTIKLNGKYFHQQLSKGEVVSGGQKVLTWSPLLIAQSGFDLTVPVVILDTDPKRVRQLVTFGKFIVAGTPILEVTKS